MADLSALAKDSATGSARRRVINLHNSPPPLLPRQWIDRSPHCDRERKASPFRSPPSIVNSVSSALDRPQCPAHVRLFPAFPERASLSDITCRAPSPGRADADSRGLVGRIGRTVGPFLFIWWCSDYRRRMMERPPPSRRRIKNEIPRGGAGAWAWEIEALQPTAEEIRRRRQSASAA